MAPTTLSLNFILPRDGRTDTNGQRETETQTHRYWDPEVMWLGCNVTNSKQFARTAYTHDLLNCIKHPGGRGNVGVRPSPLGTPATTGPITSAPSGSRWNENWEGKPKYSEKTCSSATSSIINPAWPDLGSNPGCRDEKPSTNRLG
jgi:hypothetical protein